MKLSTPLFTVTICALVAVLTLGHPSPLILGLGSKPNVPKTPFLHQKISWTTFGAFTTCYPDKDAVVFNTGDYIRAPQKLGKDVCGGRIEVTNKEGKQWWGMVVDIGPQEGLELSKPMFDKIDNHEEHKSFIGEYRFY